MNTNEATALTGTVFEDGTEITIVELCKSCSVDTTVVEELIAEGILEPTGGSSNERLFPYTSVRRTLTVTHLRRDLGVNLAGAALALDLLERIDTSVKSAGVKFIDNEWIKLLRSGAPMILNDLS